MHRGAFENCLPVANMYTNRRLEVVSLDLRVMSTTEDAPTKNTICHLPLHHHMSQL